MGADRTMYAMLLWFRLYLQKYQKGLVKYSGVAGEDIDQHLQENGYFKLKSKMGVKKYGRTSSII